MSVAPAFPGHLWEWFIWLTMKYLHTDGALHLPCVIIKYVIRAAESTYIQIWHRPQGVWTLKYKAMTTLWNPQLPCYSNTDSGRWGSILCASSNCPRQSQERPNINQVLLLCQTIGQITKKCKPEVDRKLRSCLWSLSAGRSLLAVPTENRGGSLSTVSVPVSPHTHTPHPLSSPRAPGKRIHLSGSWEQLGERSQGLGTGERYLASAAYCRWDEVCLKHPCWGSWVVKVQVL